MRKVEIDLDKILISGKPVGYEIAKIITKAEIEQYKSILGLPQQIIDKILSSKQKERRELFEAIVGAYPTISRRADGSSEYLKKNLIQAYSTWKKITKGEIEKEYLLLEKLQEYIRNTEQKYYKKLSNWLKTVVLEPEESEIFSQSDITVL